MDVHTRHVGRFSLCYFLVGTSPAGDTVGRDVCGVRDVMGCRGRCAPRLVPSCRQTRSYGKHMAGNPVPDGYLLPFPRPRSPVQLPHTEPGSAQQCGRTPTEDIPKRPLGAQRGEAGQGDSGTARQPRAAVQKRPAERRHHCLGTSAASCARALRARSRGMA